MIGPSSLQVLQGNAALGSFLFVLRSSANGGVDLVNGVRHDLGVTS